VLILLRDWKKLKKSTKTSNKSWK